MRNLLYMWKSRWFAFFHDMSWVALAIYLAFAFRFDFASVPQVNIDGGYRMLWVALPIQMISYWYFGLYRGIWRFASLPDLKRILQSVLVGLLFTYSILFVWFRLEGIPRSTFVLYPLLLVGGLAGMRLLYRWLKDRRLGFASAQGKRALLIGAGKAGELLIRDLLQTDQYLPVGFLDDARRKHGRDIHGVRVIGDINDLPHFVKELAVEVVLLAMPSASPDKLKALVNACARMHVSCQTVPPLREMQDKKADIGSLRHIRLEDLLGREEIALDDKKVRRFIAGKKVLVTGAGGSIGSELCRQLLLLTPKQLILLEQCEFNLYQIDGEMQSLNHADRVVSLLGDIRDESRMDCIFSTYQPDIIFNAAAYKHVPLVEKNPVEGIKTNVLGTCMIAELATKYKTKFFIQVSTDKAVNPANVMGATKRMAEIYCQNLNGRSSTSYITTRFGNVLGSAGSVVPLFRKQIEAGGPVTVTHPNITRYFMTIPEAVSLILQAATMGNGGEIFVLDMGKPVRIQDLAVQMIRLAGYMPDEDIEIKYTGLRPGEKLYEELFHEAELLQGTTHPKILLSGIREVEWQDVQSRMLLIQQACNERDVAALIGHLKHLVPEFTPDKRLLL